MNTCRVGKEGSNVLECLIIARSKSPGVRIPVPVRSCSPALYCDCIFSHIVCALSLLITHQLSIRAQSHSTYASVNSNAKLTSVVCSSSANIVAALLLQCIVSRAAVTARLHPSDTLPPSATNQRCCTLTGSSNNTAASFMRPGLSSRVI